MNSEKVIKELKENYPDKNIICLPEESPKEIICESDRKNGIAIAVIDKSEPHYHKNLTETYKILSGELNLIINEENFLLKPGKTKTIAPNQTHYAIGNETWVEIKANPPWTPEDHILINKNF